MNKRTTLYDWLGICLLTVGFSSCASEFPNGRETPPRGEETTGILYVPMTRGDIAAEDSIVNSSRMIVFSVSGDSLVINTTQPKNPSPYKDPTFVEIVPVGHLNVYLIANERPEWNLDAINSEAQLNSFIYDYTTNPTKLPETNADNTIPMFGMYKNIYIDRNGNTSDPLTSPNPPTAPYPITVQRIFAKVTLLFKCMFIDQSNGSTPLELQSIQLKQIPKYSYLISRRYTDTDFNDAMYDLYPIPPSPPAPPYWPRSGYEEYKSGPNVTGFGDTVSFYVPEYIANDTSYYTYLSIKVGIKGQWYIAKEYKLVLGEGMNYKDGLGNSLPELYKFMKGDTCLSNGHQRDILDLSIKRNTHYIINASIKNFGLTGDEDMDLYLEVKDWWDGDVEPKDIGDYTFNISQSEFTIPRGHTGVVRIETDHQDGWSAIASDPGLVLTVDGVTPPLVNQGSGPLKFESATARSYYIDVTVGSITKRITVVVS
jgi:hypothetical protein